MAVKGAVSGAAGNRGAASMRNKFKQTLQQKTEQSYKTKDENASTYRDYYDKGKMENVKQYRIPKGDVSVVMDIIPYFAGDHDPRNKPGDPVYVLDVNVHKNIGPMNDQIVCLAQYGKPCPVCEEVERRRAAGEDYDKRIKPLRPSRRVLYNIIIRDNNGNEEKKGVQVYETAHFFMEKKITGIAKNPRTGGIIVFSDPDDGKSISFSKRNPTKETVEYSAHQLLDRPAPITDAELDSAFVLDSLIKILGYKEIEDILYAQPDENAGGGEEQTENTTTTTDSSTQQEQQELSPRMERRRNNAPEEPVDNPVDDGDGSLTCPHGGTIGETIDELNECMTCEIYDACSEIAEKR